MNEEIKEAKRNLEKWLMDPHELGQKPFKIEYTNSFIDEDGISCMIFKYKASMFGKWMLKSFFNFRHRIKTKDQAKEI